jgi:Kef-type K+ transport system membrane component KefB
MIGGFSALMYALLHKGTILESTKSISTPVSADTSSFNQFRETWLQNFTHPMVILLLQIITIILAARLFGFFCKKIGQPTVVGEIAAGIFLGPSFLGSYLPDLSHFIFPAQSLGNLTFLSQIGLILFMFVIGMELDIKVLKNKARDAIVVSHASIIIPFALGATLAYFIYNHLAPDNIKFISFALFLGIAMSITAFPVLARIVQEKGISKTKLGTLAITCAAADDITAWCLLAAVIAIAKAGSLLSALFIIVLVLIYVFLMWKVLRPFLKKLGDIYYNKESLSKPIVAIFFATLLLSSCLTELIGIHALFGAFMAGVIMPDNIRFRNIFIEKVEDVAIVILLPLFFVLTGLRTQIGLLNDAYLWQVCLLVIILAIVGKFVGSMLAARFVGQPWKDSLIIGALMNTRGLMELIVLNIGFDMGILSSEIFAMLVIMAVATTFMTGPALYLINRLIPAKISPVISESMQENLKYKILLSFGNPLNGKILLKLAHALVSKSIANSSVTALHLSPGNDLNQYNIEEYEQDSFQPLTDEAGKLNLPLITLFKPTQDVDRDIVETANLGSFDLLLAGTGRSIFEGTLLGKILGFTTKFISPERLYDTITGKEKFFENRPFDDRTRHIIKSAKVPVGILIDKGFSKADNIFLPVFSANDIFLLAYAQRFIHNNESRVIILDHSGIIKHHAEIKEAIRSIEQIAPNHIAILYENKLDKEFLEQQDIMLISLESWKKAIETQSIWLSQTPSILIIKP